MSSYVDYKALNIQDIVVKACGLLTGGDIHYLFCENEDKDNFSGNIALIMLYVQQTLFAVDYLHWKRNILHLDIKGTEL